MIKVLLRITRLFAGLFTFALGIVITINADLGLAPWDALHQGLSKSFHITIGQANIAIGVVLVVLNSLLGERIGWGTLANMLFIGIFVDILMLNSLVPVFESIVLRIIMLLAGMFVIGIGSYLYIGTELASGPRDGLMIVLTKKTGKSVGFTRNSIEITVLVIGYLLGGSIGIGTFLTALLIGHFVQVVFKLFKFDVSRIKHRFIDQDLRHLKEELFRNKQAKAAERKAS